jgi:hypothetical protein
MHAYFSRDVFSKVKAWSWRLISLFIRSTTAFSTFEYANVRQSWVFLSKRNTRLTSATKCGPLSERGWSGAPNQPKCFNKHCAADKAVASRLWYSSTQRVNVSMITKTYPSSGNSPTKSMIRHSIGVYVEVVKPWAWMGIFSKLIFWHQGQWSMKCLTFCRWNSQTCPTAFKRRRVGPARNAQHLSCAPMISYGTVPWWGWISQ